MVKKIENVSMMEMGNADDLSDHFLAYSMFKAMDLGEKIHVNKNK